MKYPYALILLAVAVTSIGTGYAKDDNQITVVIGNGPFAGTYHADSPICMRAKSQDVFGAGWKDFNAKGDKAFAEAGLGVYAPDLPGPKKGRADVAFGEDKNKVEYHFSPVPVTLEIKGKGGIIRFDGTTPQGIKVHMEAVCKDVDSV